MPVASPLRSHRNQPRGRHAPARPHNRIGNATGGTDTRIFDNQNRTTEMNSSPVTRDALGNITEDHLGNEFGYDAWNRLTTHDATDRYGYDALNRRNRFATRDLHYDADGNIIEEREDGIVTLQHHYSKSGQGIVARRNFASGSYSSTYYAMTLTDGSVMTIISSTGVQLEHYVYNPNGLVEMYAEGEFGDWTHDPERPDREGAYAWTVGWAGGRWDVTSALGLTFTTVYSPFLDLALQNGPPLIPNGPPNNWIPPNNDCGVALSNYVDKLNALKAVQVKIDSLNRTLEVIAKDRKVEHELDAAATKKLTSEISQYEMNIKELEDNMKKQPDYAVVWKDRIEAEKKRIAANKQVLDSNKELLEINESKRVKQTKEVEKALNLAKAEFNEKHRDLWSAWISARAACEGANLPGWVAPWPDEKRWIPRNDAPPALPFPGARRPGTTP